MADPIEFTIRAFLLSQPEMSALVGDKITPLYPDEGAEFPYVVYQASKPKRERDLDGEFSDIGNFVLSFKVVSNSYVNLKLIAAELVAALENYEDSTEQYQFISCDVEEADQDSDPEFGWVSQDFIADITFQYLR